MEHERNRSLSNTREIMITYIVKYKQPDGIRHWYYQKSNNDQEAKADAIQWLAKFNDTLISLRRFT